MPRSSPSSSEREASADVLAAAAAISSADRRSSERAADRLAHSLTAGGRAKLMRALGVEKEVKGAFDEMDFDKDGVVTRKEYDRFQAESKARASLPLTNRQKVLVTVRGMVEMFGFGLTDNTIMLTCGAALERALGPTLGITGFAAAACGNMIADSAGVVTTTTINKLTAPFLPDIGLSDTQERFESTQAFAQAGQVIGVMMGGACGTWPLLAQRLSNRWKGAASVSAAANPAVARAARIKDARIALGTMVLFSLMASQRIGTHKQRKERAA